MGPGGALPELVEIAGGDPAHVLTIPVQQTFSLERVAEAQALSQAGHLSGKLVVLVD
jgi:hypothetical protein